MGAGRRSWPRGFDTLPGVAVKPAGGAEQGMLRTGGLRITLGAGRGENQQSRKLCGDLPKVLEVRMDLLDVKGGIGIDLQHQWDVPSRFVSARISG